MADKATISLNGEFTATELEEVIQELSKVRAGMEPAVPQTLPTVGDSAFMEQDETLFTIRTLADGGIRIWLRSEGSGWMAFRLSATRRKELFEFLGKKIGHTHTAH